MGIGIVYGEQGSGLREQNQLNIKPLTGKGFRIFGYSKSLMLFPKGTASDTIQSLTISCSFISGHLNL